MSRETSRRLARYLTDGPDQRRLLDQMAAGHARGKHGHEFGNPEPAAYRAVVKAHLRRADLGFAVTDPDGRQRFLLLDQRSGTAAWITPGKEHRSTMFKARDGIGMYLGGHLDAASPQRWRSLDLGRLRGLSPPGRTRGHARGHDLGR